MEVTDKIVQILVQSGLTGIALASLWINYKVVSNHMSHSTDATNRLEIAITKLSEFLQIKMG